jgi:DNA polymerase-3 subunit delta'
MHPWNQPILESLRSMRERLPHALLLHGPRGVGKLELAERVAQFLLCEHADAAKQPCDKCDACRWYLAGNHPDMRLVEPEAFTLATFLSPKTQGGSLHHYREPIVERIQEELKKEKKPSLQIKIEQVRELGDFLNLASHRSATRLALIHPAEDMNANAANALLKGLEEPPAGAMFILVSHRPARLLPTIRSRCVALPVAIPSRDVAIGWLKQQGAENAERWLAYAGGAPVQALRYAEEAVGWDRLLKSPAPVDDRENLERLAEVLQKIAYDRAFSAFGLAPKYKTGAPAGNPGKTRRWLAFARKMGEQRALSRHPLNARLFSTDLLAQLESVETKQG